MSIPLPAFLLRRALLKRAQELLEAHDPRAAIAILGDPLLRDSRPARELTARANVQLEALAESAAATNEPNAATALKDLLAELRAKRGTESVSPAGLSAASHALRAVSSTDAPSKTANVRFRIAIDDAGEFLVVSGTSITIGHLSAAHASAPIDLPFLSGIEREHAHLEIAHGFHGGSSWRIRPIGDARVVVDGRAVTGSGQALEDGDRVRLGQNLDFVFLAREAASSSAILELQHGAECCGASRVLLFASGPEGRVRIGAKRTRQIQVAGLAHEIALEIVASSHTKTSRMTIHWNPASETNCADQSFEESAQVSAVAVVPTFEIDCPPLVTKRFSSGGPSAGRPPFSIVVSPLEEEIGGERSAETGGAP